MGFLSQATLFGLDIFGFVQGKRKAPTVIRDVSFLQSFKSLIFDVGQKEEVIEKVELSNMTKILAQRLGEHELLSASEKFVPQPIAKEITKAAVPPLTSHLERSVTDLEGILEVPQSLLDVILE